MDIPRSKAAAATWKFGRTRLRYFAGSLGNNIGYYFRARACARMGGMDFVFLRFLLACPGELYAWLPAVVATSAAKQPEATAFAHGYTHGREDIVFLRKILYGRHGISI